MKAAVVTFPGSNCDRDLAVARIEPGDDVAGEGVTGIRKEAGVLHRGRADHDVGDAGVEIGLDRIEIPDPAAKLHRQCVAGRLSDVADRLLVLRPACRGAVQIDHVQTPRALRGPVLRHRRRVVGEHGRGLHVALFEAHAVAVLQVNGGDDQHAQGSGADRRFAGARKRGRGFWSREWVWESGAERRARRRVRRVWRVKSGAPVNEIS